jgi:hypothetical protein
MQKFLKSPNNWENGLSVRRSSSFPAVSKKCANHTEQLVFEGSGFCQKCLDYGLRTTLAFFHIFKTAQANRKKDLHSNRPLKNLGSG